MKLRNVLTSFFLLLIVFCCATVLFACDDGGASVHEHAWGEWKVTTEPTCTALGIQTRTCACGSEETKLIPANDHDYGDFTQTLSATCMREGERYRTCKVCSYKDVQTVAVDASAHDFDTLWSKDGEQHWYICKNDGCQAKSCVGEHQLGTLVATTPPTCIANGAGYRQCQVCSYKKNFTILPVASAHTCDATSWGGDEESHWRVCTRNGCGAHYEVAPHSFGENAVCSGCGAVRQGLSYLLVGDTYTVARYEGEEAVVTVPATYKGVAVTAIGDYVFSDHPTLKKIVLPDSILKIGVSAFSGSILLEEVVMPNGVREIGQQAFSGCLRLSKLTIPTSLEVIEYGAFVGVAWTSVTIPKSVRIIGEAAFATCEQLTTVEFEAPCSVHTIGQEAFAGCISLNKFDTPASVTTVGKWAFPDHWDAPLD